MASGADRISDLPEGVLHHIVSLLPARDAVRMCVLAQSWRNCWRSAPALRFACSTGLAGGVDAFGHFVDAPLPPPPRDSCDFDLDVVDLDPCHFALESGSAACCSSRSGSSGSESPPTFSATPSRWSIRPSPPRHLTSLELTGVEGDTVALDFSGCSALESLKMEASHVWATEMQSPSLKHLSIKYCCFYPECRTGMSFPSLVSFEFIKNSGRAPMLERMPYLETAKVRFDHVYDDRCKNGRLDDCGDDDFWCCFYYYGPDDSGSGSVFLQGLAEATYLNLSAYPDLYVFNRDLKWCPAFNKLKTLVLIKWFLCTDLSALIWFLHHTPLLEKLTLEIPKEHKSLMETEGSYNPLEKSIAPSHLQIVEIICKDVDGIALKF